MDRLQGLPSAPLINPSANAQKGDIYCWLQPLFRVKTLIVVEAVGKIMAGVLERVTAAAEERRLSHNSFIAFETEPLDTGHPLSHSSFSPMLAGPATPHDAVLKNCGLFQNAQNPHPLSSITYCHLRSRRSA
jgi:hypothetical protein